MHTQSRNDPLCPDTEEIFHFQFTKQFNSVLEIKRAQSINTEGKKKLYIQIHCTLLVARFLLNETFAFLNEKS